MIITSIVVAATAAAVSEKFNAFGTVGGIIAGSVSTSFLIILGIMNAYILYRLVKQMKKVLELDEGEVEEGRKFEGGGCLFLVLKKMFKLINRFVLSFFAAPFDPSVPFLNNSAPIPFLIFADLGKCTL